MEIKGKGKGKKGAPSSGGSLAAIMKMGTDSRPFNHNSDRDGGKGFCYNFQMHKPCKETPCTRMHSCAGCAAPDVRVFSLEFLYISEFGSGRECFVTVGQAREASARARHSTVEARIIQSTVPTMSGTLVKPISPGYRILLMSMELRWCKHGTGPIPCVIVKPATWFTSAVHHHTKHWWSWTPWTVSGTVPSKRFSCCLRQRHGLVLVTLKMTRRDQYGTGHIQQGSQNSALRLRSMPPEGTATLKSHARSQNKRYSVLITKFLCFFSSPKISEDTHKKVQHLHVPAKRTPFGTVPRFSSFCILHVRLPKLSTSPSSCSIDQYDSFRS